MRFYSWNVNGIRANVSKGTFVKFIKTHQPDILGLQETRAMQGQTEIDLPDYQEFWNSADKKGYSGTAIFSKITPLNITFDFPQEISNKYSQFEDSHGNTLNEGRVTTAEYKEFYYVNVYTPNSKSDLKRLNLRHKVWDPAFLDYIKLLEKSKPVIFCGDLNVAHTPDDLANPKQNEGKHGYTKEEREGIQKYIDAGFLDTFRMFTKGNGHYSWWTHWANARARNVGWRIDYFFVSDSLKNRVKSANIHPKVMGSDHCPISIELK